jgi:hypothetical protein
VTKFVVGLAVLALAISVTGCSINDSTETEFAPQIINNTRWSATMLYCGGTSSCGKPWWTERLRPGQSTSDSINAGHGNLSVFLVMTKGTRGCIRLAHYTKAIHLSDATPAACHRPYAG